MTRLLVENLPLVSVSKGPRTLLIDAEMMINSKDMFANLMSAIKASDGEEKEADQEFDSLLMESKCNKRPGRKTFLEKYPEIMGFIQDFVTNAGVAAHHKRREEIGSFGFRIPLLRDYLLKRFFKENPEDAPSLSTLRRIFTAPDTKAKASKRYQNLIKARPVAVENCDVAGMSVLPLSSW